MGEDITRGEYDEAMRRIDAEEKRQNERLRLLEDNYTQLTDLTVSVQRIALSIESMQKELTKQGERLEKIEQEPAENWKKVVWLVIAALVGFGIHALLGI